MRIKFNYVRKYNDTRTTRPRELTVPLTQEQFDAIISFAFNVGEGSLKKGTGFKGSKFLSELNKGNYNGNLMMNFHRPAEIVPRRQREVNLFNKGQY